jgi:hypothetical protein
MDVDSVPADLGFGTLNTAEGPVTMRLTQKAVTAELKRLGHEARLESGDGYFYFLGLEPANWLDKTVKVPKVSSLTLEQWVAEYERLKKLNEEILRK